MFRTPLILAAAVAATAPPATAQVTPPGARTFTFTYAADVTGLPDGQTARVWIPVPSTTPEQKVEVLERAAPGRSRITRDAEYGNTIWYTEAAPDAAGTIHLTARYKVTRFPAGIAKLDDDKAARFLRPDKFVPIDGKPLKLIAGKALPPDPTAKARALYDVVFDYMKYSKDGVGWGRGDAAWACDSRFGNCSDFHSLFISLARSQRLPAMFEMGFGLPVEKGKGEIGGYHCWAKVKVGDAWLPVDISEPNKLAAKRDDYFGKLPPNRVALATGRDITLEPKQDGEPLNLFVYPYVEVAGRPHPADKIKSRFTFADE